jgi:hypothetical protein
MFGGTSYFTFRKEGGVKRFFQTFVNIYLTIRRYDPPLFFTVKKN